MGPRTYDPGTSGSGKRWYFLSAEHQPFFPGGVYSYIALSSAIRGIGGWEVTDAWGQGSFQGFTQQEPATGRAVRAGLVREDGSVPTWYTWP